MIKGKQARTINAKAKTKIPCNLLGIERRIA